MTDYTEIIHVELTRGDAASLGAALAAWIEDFERDIKKQRKLGHDVSGMLKRLLEVEELTYTKIIPDSWCGPRPAHWSKA